MKEKFIHKNFQGKTLNVIDQANRIIIEYRAQGFTLTVRQLFYQFVSKDWLKNTPLNYERLGSIIDDARKAGLIDWDAVEDRGRFVRKRGTYDSAADFIERLHHYAFAHRIWNTQPVYCEVWIEKDALIGVIERVCFELRVSYLACRGYASSSAKYEGAQRFKRKLKEGKRCILFHLGDHDPSGVQMTEDNADAIGMYARSVGIEVIRLGLNLDQVREYDPPPNSAKESDSRFAQYVDQFGFEDCWELDALRPQVIETLIRDAISEIIDQEKWDKAIEAEKVEREQLRLVGENWDDVSRYFKFRDREADHAQPGLTVDTILQEFEDMEADPTEE